MTPRIGITTYQGGTASPKAQRYAAAIRAAGGEPIWLEPADVHASPSPEAVLARLDGLLLSGGMDIDPRHFGETVIEGAAVEIDVERDAAELPLTRAALACDLPILGICRGIQTLNVAAGGSLYQDLSLMGVDVQMHLHNGGRQAQEAAHDIQLVAPTRLRSVFDGERAEANSFHHQAVRTVASELIVSARAPDGVIEGLEHPARRFVIGVQWHPERMVDHHYRQRRLFEAFIAAAQRSSARHPRSC